MNDSDEEGLIETAKANSASVSDAFARASTLKDFLMDEDARVSIHCINATKMEQELFIDKAYDIDGVVVELRSVAGIASPIFYLLLPQSSVNAVYHVLKKHECLNSYSVRGLKCLLNAVGTHVAYSIGYRITVCILPKPEGCTALESAANARHSFSTFFQNVRRSFVQKLRGLPPRDMARPSIQKNPLFNPSNLNVLPDDQTFILSLLDDALKTTELPEGTRLVIFASRFGQKQMDPLYLANYFQMDAVESLSVHAACNLSCERFRTHLFWSRDGVQEVIGTRGRVFSSLSLIETANFQTNLDGRLLDISGDLRRVSRFPEKLTFLQLYADTPHRREEDAYAHPVSGVITTCGLLHPQTNTAMKKRANNYLQNMVDNGLKLGCITHCRMELVTRFESGSELHSAGMINAAEFFNATGVDGLLTNHPMLIPFYEDWKFETKFTNIVQGIAWCLIEELRGLLEACGSTGGFLASWRSYQLELALEIFFWGQSRVRTDELYCTNLGVSVANERSSTYQRGLLCLDPCNSAVVSETPPPLHHWLKSEEQQRRVNRIFRFSDCLEASDSVVGRNVLLVLLGDLYDGHELFLHSLQGDDPPVGGRCVGTVTADQLAVELSKTSRFKYPFTYYRASEMLASSEKSLIVVVKCGLLELKLSYFPALKFVDQSRNEKASWNGKDFWNLILPDKPASFCARVATLTGDVIVSLISRKLTFSRNLDSYREEGMPWMEPVFRRLEELQLQRESLVHVCTFVTSVALLQNGVFIDYNALNNLELDLPVSQQRLQRMEVLSRFLYPGLNHPKVWRLHEKIPLKRSPTKVAADTSVERRKKWVDLHVREQVVEEQHPVELEDTQEVPPVPQRRHLPARWKRPWSSQELGLLNEALKDSSKSYKEKYRVYERLCFEGGVPARTSVAFKLKAIQLAGTRHMR